MDGEPVFGSYFRALAFVISEFIKKDKSLITFVFKKILGTWPRANSKKVSQLIIIRVIIAFQEILMLHEMEKILEELPSEQFHSISTDLFEKLSVCIQRRDFKGIF